MIATLAARRRASVEHVPLERRVVRNVANGATTDDRVEVTWVDAGPGPLHIEHRGLDDRARSDVAACDDAAACVEARCLLGLQDDFLGSAEEEPKPPELGDQ